MSEREILGPSRKVPLAWMRYCLANVIDAAFPGISPVAVGRAINRNHSTVLYLMCKLDKLPSMFTSPWKFEIKEAPKRLIRMPACRVD